METDASRLLIIVFIGLVGVRFGLTYQFNRMLTGIEFYPYVKAEDANSIPDRSSYTDENVKTMLEVVSTKFTRLLASSIDAYSAPRNEGNTNYHYSSLRAKATVIAAQINRERNNLSLTFTLGIWDRNWEHSEKFNAELQIALEATRASHSIFPGTVEGLFLSNYENKFTWTNETLKAVKLLRASTAHFGIRTGTKHYCDYLSLEKIRSEDILDLIKEIISNVDFVVCANVPDTEYYKHSGSQGFSSIQAKVLRNQIELLLMNPNVEVMLNTFWKKSDNITTQDISNFRDYWYSADKFATKHNFTTWLNGNFDEPRGGRHMGWWKLTQFKLINNVSGYVETTSIAGVRENANILEAVKYTKSSETSESTYYVKFGAAVTGTIVGTVLAGIVYRKYRKRNLSNSNILTCSEIDLFRHGYFSNELGNQSWCEFTINEEALQLPYDTLLEIPITHLDILSDQVLGHGQCGKVFKATIKCGSEQNNKVVALKVTGPEGGSRAVKGLLSEIKILTYLGYHTNIVPICGANTAKMHKGIVYLATELCASGSLKQFLNSFKEGNDERDTSKLLYNDMVRWAHEIACGMEYLSQKRVVHMDLSARNVLLSSEKVARISDFGLSRILNENNIYSKAQDEPLPWRWMAIESLEMFEFSAKSDVWSYGVTLWEIFSLAALPFPHFERTPEFVLLLKSGLRLSRPRYATSDLFEIMERCWILDKDGRPTFTEIKNLTSDIHDYSKESCYSYTNERMEENGRELSIPNTYAYIQ